MLSFTHRSLKVGFRSPSPEDLEKIHNALNRYLDGSSSRLQGFRLDGNWLYIYVHITAGPDIVGEESADFIRAAVAGALLLQGYELR